MENKGMNLLKSTMTYGLYLGVVFVIYSLVLYILGVMPVGIGLPMLMMVISLAIFFIGILFGTKKVRGEVFNGEITYAQGLAIGVLIALFASIISSVYSYIQNTIIDPEYLTNLANAQKEWMYNYLQGKLPETQIDAQLSQMDEQIKNASSIASIFKGILGWTIGGFIISIITSAFLKKKSNPFDNQVG